MSASAVGAATTASPGLVEGSSHEADGCRAPIRSAGPTRSLTARLLLMIFRGYQLLRVGRVSPCRFTPTCSVYATEAVERHGAAHGAVLAARRLGRCRPGGPSGYDPVPE